MSPMRVTCRRTVSMFRNRLSCALLSALFLAVTATRFAFALNDAEGQTLSLAAVWAMSVAPFLPALVALLAMDVWSDERKTGRIDQLLSIAVRERELAWGKLLGVWITTLAAILMSLITTMTALAFMSPVALSHTCLSALLPAVLILALQAAMWSALSTMVSAWFYHSSASACVSLALFVALPRAAWSALVNWAPLNRNAFGDFPLDAHVVDFATGTLSTGVIVAYLAVTIAAAIICTKTIYATHFKGRKATGSHLSTATCMVLAIACATAYSILAVRLNVTLEMTIAQPQTVPPQLKHVLTESSGTITATCFMPRNSKSFKTVAHMLRAVKRAADAAGGINLNIAYVDPKWDVGNAERLIRMGARENSLVIARNYRFVSLAADESVNYGSVASAIKYLTMPPQRRDICWTIGHGEIAFDSYGEWGMSDIARALTHEGYRNTTIELAANREIPPNCALLAVAGAKNEFSRAELDKIDKYLRGGGRLLVMMGRPGQSGVASILPAWGIRPINEPIVGARTLTGSDVIVSDFADHAITAPLAGSRIILEKPLAFASSAAAESGKGADKIEYSAVAKAGNATLVAAVERGATIGSDLSIRPTRIVVVGDSSIVMNGQLATRANANREFFLNAVAYLSGSDASASVELGDSGVFTDMDRNERMRHALITILAIPGAIFVLLGLIALHRRNRK